MSILSSVKNRLVGFFCLGLCVLDWTSFNATGQDKFNRVISLLQSKCQKCHGKDESNAEIDLSDLKTRDQWLKHPELVSELISALDGNNMPPEDEPQLSESEKSDVLLVLKHLLAQAKTKTANVPIRRLNRFQYNYTVKDLFQLEKDPFALPEKLMTRQSRYLENRSGTLPTELQVTSHSLAPQPGLRGVKPFPKDLRATHGFDNQANELTLSPLLLDAFLRLSISIVESPDFNENTVGIWKEFFAEPDPDTKLEPEIKDRINRFLSLAFRGPVDDETIRRYSSFASNKIKAGLPFTDSMKKVASAALSSPRFLYRVQSMDRQHQSYHLASKLSFFLWSSGPDRELLDLAEKGELIEPATLRRTVARMIADPRIERFLDSFPAQWMQLENVLAATPDPGLNRYFRLDKQHPASLQMLIEPLLLFDAVFLENLPVEKLIQPEFSYRSEFLDRWYHSELKAPRVDKPAIIAQNEKWNSQRTRLTKMIAAGKAERDALRKMAKERLLMAASKAGDAPQPVDLKPIAAWEFQGDLKDSIGSLHLEPKGKIQFQDGQVILDRSYLLSSKLKADLKAKSLEIWFKLDQPDQAGGGLMGIQGPGDFFDTIVIGERKPRHWISGSNGFSRTEDFADSTEESNSGETIHLVMVYEEDGLTTLYRNGHAYGKPYRKGKAVFPKDRSSVIFGLRHLPPGGNKFLKVVIDKARLYDRALTPEEASASYAGSSYISEKKLLESFSKIELEKYRSTIEKLDKLAADLKNIPKNVDPKQAQRNAQKRFVQGLIQQLKSTRFRRKKVTDRRFGGVITNAAMLSMTSGPKRTHPIARGAWIIEVILNDPPSPPPNDVPPLNEDSGDPNQTIREKFAAHRENPSCAGCHSRLDPLGFAMENFDITGRWRDKYRNGRAVDASGVLVRQHKFENVIQFKESLVAEKDRFAKAFIQHLLRFASSRELIPEDLLVVDEILDKTKGDGYRLKDLILEVILSESFTGK